MGLSFELDKCELIHFAARKANLGSNPDINLTKPDGSNHVLRASNVIRWLGFFLDRRLDFKDHVAKMAIKALSIIAGLRLLANSVRGLSVKHSRLLYRSCVIPVLTYGSPIWYRGSKSKAIITPLIRAQNVGLRWMLGAFKTSPISAMEHVAAILPIPLLLQRLSENAASRLRRLPVHSEVARRLPQSWDAHDSSLPQPRTPRSGANPLTVIHHLASLSDPLAEFTLPYLSAPWESPHPWGSRLSVSRPHPKASRDERNAYIKQAHKIITLSQADSSLTCFTDGSKRIVRGCRRVGAGFVIYSLGKEIHAGRTSLGPRTDVFDAEMLALALAAHRACDLGRTIPNPTVRFFVDNIAAVDTISDLKPHPAQSSSILFRRAIDRFLRLNPLAKVEIHWVPGHSGIVGNERADQLANEGGMSTPEPLFNRSITWAAANAKAKAIRNWGRAWQSGPHSAHVMQSLPGLPKGRLHPFHAEFNGPRHIHSRLIQVILGHAFYGGYYNRFVPSEDSSCPCKRAQIQTLQHVLLECSLFSAARMALRRASKYLCLQELFTSSSGLRALANFLSSCSAFSK